MPDAEAEADGELERENSDGSLKKGESIYEITVEDAPIMNDMSIEEESENIKEEESSPAKQEKKHRRVPSLLRKTSEVNLANLVGTPYNVVHKSHVNFDYQWSGDAAEAFEYKEKIGQGGYGAVFKAIHKETGFTLAIKALTNVSGERGRADLQKEIDILKKCRCGNVLSYYGSIAVKNEIWILMDLCSVGSIKDLMKTCVETLDEVQIAMVAREVLRGLAYLHEIGIVHMDVKAANILLTEDGGVKLADFGVSQQLQAATSQSDVLIGSPLWMAPEIIMKNPYDHRADMWSLGITLIELAEGRAPPRGLKKIEDLIATVNLPPPSLSNPRSWSPMFIDFINKCLKKDPAERPGAISLLSHPFVEKAQGPEVMMGLIKDCVRIKQAKAEKEREREREKAAAVVP